MGVAKAWRCGGGALSNVAAVAAVQHRQKHHLFVLCASSSRRPISWTAICGVMLFALGLISLFTGHVASNLEWYSQHSWLFRRVIYAALSYLSFLSANGVFSLVPLQKFEICQTRQTKEFRLSYVFSIVDLRGSIFICVMKMLSICPR